MRLMDKPFDQFDKDETLRTLKGCISRICVSDDPLEIVRMVGFANDHIAMLAQSRMMQIRAMLTADVAKVRHGYWLHKMSDYYPYSECSLCGYTLAGDLGNYCKNCGAKMDAERSEQ